VSVPKSQKKKEKGGLNLKDGAHPVRHRIFLFAHVWVGKKTSSGTCVVVVVVVVVAY
jgi:hypothetical protein